LQVLLKLEFLDDEDVRELFSILAVYFESVSARTNISNNSTFGDDYRKRYEKYKEEIRPVKELHKAVSNVRWLCIVSTRRSPSFKGHWKCKLTK